MPSLCMRARTANAGEKFRPMRPIKQKGEEGRVCDLIDAVSRIHDMEIMPPITINQRDLEPEIFVDRYKPKRHGSLRIPIRAMRLGVARHPTRPTRPPHANPFQAAPPPYYRDLRANRQSPMDLRTTAPLGTTMM